MTNSLRMAGSSPLAAEGVIDVGVHRLHLASPRLIEQ
jgi:hypothetical protein